MESKKKKVKIKIGSTGNTIVDILLVVLGVVVILGVFAGILFLVPYVFMLAWNGVLVDMFGFPVITFWKSFGLLFILSVIGSCLTKGFRVAVGKDV